MMCVQQMLEGTCQVDRVIAVTAFRCCSINSGLGIPWGSSKPYGFQMLLYQFGIGHSLGLIQTPMSRSQEFLY
jgi:hypothetical protein